MVDWRDFLVLEKNEYVVQWWVAECLVKLKGGEYRRGGILALTNQRLVYLKHDRFFLPRSYETTIAIPLESINGIEYEGDGGPYPNMNIYTSEGKHTLRSINTSEKPTDQSHAEYFKDKVMEQMKERRQELERKKTSAMVDFSFLKTYIEKGGIVLATLKCPNCNAPITMPKDGTETVCKHCSNTVYAIDIFEKVKKLIE